MKKIIFNTAKEQFRKAFRKHKSQVKRAKLEAKKGKNTPVEPYGLKKRAIKRSIRGTKFMDKSEYLAAPKTKSLPAGGPRPKLIGKAYASDKKGKGLQINPLSKKDRQKIQDEISESVKKFLKRRKDEPRGFKKGKFI